MSGRDDLRCPNCGADIPDDSRFCLGCGKEMPGKSLPEQAPEDSEPSVSSMMLFALSFMIFFFAIVPIILGSWEGGCLMIAAGVVLVIIAFLNLNASRKHAEKIAEQRERAAERMQRAAELANVKIKCRYCGALNDRSALKCESCGATL